MEGPFTLQVRAWAVREIAPAGKNLRPRFNRTLGENRQEHAAFCISAQYSKLLPFELGN